MNFTSITNNSTNAGDFETQIVYDASISQPTIIHALVSGRTKTDSYAWYEFGNPDVKITALDGSPVLATTTWVSVNSLSILITDPALDGQVIKINLITKLN